MKLVSFWQKKDKNNLRLNNLLMIIDAWRENYFIAHVCICKFTFKSTWASETFLLNMPSRAISFIIIMPGLHFYARNKGNTSYQRSVKGEGVGPYL